MRNLNSNTYFYEKPFNHTYIANPQFSKNFSELKTGYTTFQNTNLDNKIFTSYDKYKSQQLLNSVQIRNHHCHKCHPHHFHIHHIHIPQERLYEALNLNNYNSDLMKEVLELKNECRKFREELEINQNEKNAGNLYIRDLENNLYKSQNNNDKEKNKNENEFNRYHDMLDKSFELMNSVSKKCDNNDAKMKGGVYYYKDKNNEYNKLIESQKSWIDNLPENIDNKINAQNNIYFDNLPGNQMYNRKIGNDKNRKTSSFNYNPNEKDNNNIILDNNLEQNIFQSENKDNKKNEIIEQNKKKSGLFFDAKRNNNKGYIIKKGEKINNYNDEEKEDNEENIFKNNYNTDPNINDKNKINFVNSLLNKSNKKKSYPINENNIVINDNEKNDNKEILDKEKLNNEDNLINNDNNNQNIKNIQKEEAEEEDEKDPLNERYILVDKDGNPILIKGEKLLGMELIPLIGEDEKEIIDENGNILLIGPDGQSKNQDDLEPIILDDDKILVNEENKPILGLDGVPLINIDGNPITGPNELLDNENKKVQGVVGYVAKDSKGNPIKINIKDKNNKINDNNAAKNKIKDYSNLRPLLDLNGKPILDSNNNIIFLDQNNKPVRNKGLSILLNKEGGPVLNEFGQPIIVGQNERQINEEMPEENDNYYNNRNMKIKNKKRNKKDRNIITYSQCNPGSLKKINFLRPYKDPFYDDFEYKGNCFACDVGCSVSKSGYSCMNYSPYNNRIRRKNVTPIKVSSGYGKKNKKHFKKGEIKKSKKYHLA